MSDNKVTMGFKETKEVLDFVIPFGVATEGALKDGQVSLSDLPLFLPSFLKLVPAIEGADQVALEFKLASQEEIDELKAYLKDKLDLADDQMEKFIEDAFGLVLTIWSLVNTYFIKKPVDEKVDTTGDMQINTAEASPVE